jgi:hypothetical protein
MERTFPLDEPDGRLTKDGIRIHQHADFAGMHRAGRVAAEILDAVAPLVEPGVTTETLDDFIRDEVGGGVLFRQPSVIAAISMPRASA